LVLATAGIADVLVAGLLLIAAIGGSALLWWWGRRLMRRTETEEEGGGQWTLQTLRELKARGQISDAEYERLKARMFGEPHKSAGSGAASRQGTRKIGEGER
jgi:uncharacterized membrane protein